MAKELQEFIARAEARGFTAVKVTDRLYLFTKEGWPRFHYLEANQDHPKSGITLPYLNPKAGQTVQDWLVTLEQYLRGKLIVGAEDGTELGEILQHFQEQGAEIVEVGPKDYFVKSPGLLAMQHIWEDPGNGMLKTTVLNQLA